MMETLLFFNLYNFFSCKIGNGKNTKNNQKNIIESYGAS